MDKEALQLKFKESILARTYGFTPIEGGWSVSVLYNKSVAVADLPDEYQGKPILEFGESLFLHAKRLQTVRFPSTLLRLGDGCFFGAELLEGLSLPQSVTQVGKRCFAYCTRLKEATLMGVSSLPEKCFFFCDKLERVLTQPLLEVGESCFDGAVSLEDVCVNEGTIKGARAFQNAKKLLPVYCFLNVGGNNDTV